MKKIVFVFVASLAMISCQNELMDDIGLTSDSTLNSFDAKSRSVAENDSTIYPLNENDFITCKSGKRQTDSGLYDELRLLEGIPFRVRSASSGNKNTLQSNGKGKEIILANYDEGITEQLFRIRILPATSGIPYLIYSNKENLPIGVGSYKDKPNDYVLFTKASESGGLFGFSWDFYNSTDNQGLVIENQDVIGSTGTGGPYDFFYYSITASNGKIGLEKTIKSRNQEFTFVPEGKWEIMSIETSKEGASIVSTEDVEIQKKVVNNRGSSTVVYETAIDKIIKDSVYFREYKKITTSKKLKPSFSVKLFKIVSLGIGFDFGPEEVVETEYSESTFKQTEIKDNFTFNALPQRTTVATYYSFRHKLRIPYTLKLKRDDGKTLNIKGMYEGVGYTENRLDIDEYPLGSVRSGEPWGTPISHRTIDLRNRK